MYTLTKGREPAELSSVRQEARVAQGRGQDAEGLCGPDTLNAAATGPRRGGERCPC